MHDYPIMRGKMLIKANAMSMNCGELADISAWYAYEETKDVKVIATVSLESPGDHCFCIVGPRNRMVRETPPAKSPFLDPPRCAPVDR